MKKRKDKKVRKGEIDKAILMMAKASFEAIRNGAESPLEEKFGSELLWRANQRGLFVGAISPSMYGQLYMTEPENMEREQLALSRYYLQSDLLIVPNTTISLDGKSYRVDFLLSYKTENNKRGFVCVECDSFMYHSSATQLDNDKKRERELRRVGWEMIRFSGKEITHNCAGAVDELLDTLKLYGKK